jgi:hypothetical protein
MGMDATKKLILWEGLFYEKFYDVFWGLNKLF